MIPVPADARVPPAGLPADRRGGTLSVNGAWAEPGAPADAGDGIRATLHGLAGWLGAEDVRVGRGVPRTWARAPRG